VRVLGVAGASAVMLRGRAACCCVANRDMVVVVRDGDVTLGGVRSLVRNSGQRCVRQGQVLVAHGIRRQRGRGRGEAHDAIGECQGGGDRLQVGNLGMAYCPRGRPGRVEAAQRGSVRPLAAGARLSRGLLR
jgi:hypothetical protein